RREGLPRARWCRRSSGTPFVSNGHRRLDHADTQRPGEVAEGRHWQLAGAGREGGAPRRSGISFERIKPEIQESFIQYLKKCADVLDQYWNVRTPRLSDHLIVELQKRENERHV